MFPWIHDLFSEFYLAVTGEAISSDADYWYYGYPQHDYGDCVFMYGNTYNMNTVSCSYDRVYVCEIHWNLKLEGQATL